MVAATLTLHRYLRPGGLLIVTSSNPQPLKSTSARARPGAEDVGHYRFRLERPPLFGRMREIYLLAPELLRSLAVQAGWETRAMHGDHRHYGLELVAGLDAMPGPSGAR